MYDVAFIGTGADPDNPSSDGFAMAYRHADAYEQLDNCRIVACADLVRENAEAFAQKHHIEPDHVYEEYQEMLATAEPDIVSICTPPAVHAEIVIDTARSGVVDAIHCEKPMALTWGGARLMAQECQRHDVQLTFNHQRRFLDVFREAKALLDSDTIGELERIVYTWGNFFDNGTHAIDLCNYFNNEHAPEWVLAALDYRTENVLFGAHNEDQILALWEYTNGVSGMASTGTGAGIVEGDWHLEGTDGTIDIIITDGLKLKIQQPGEPPEVVEFEWTSNLIGKAIESAVTALTNESTPELGATNALNATEIIFAGYESVRRRGRVDLPLTIEDNPLEEMVATGMLEPEPQTEEDE